MLLGPRVLFEPDVHVPRRHKSAYTEYGKLNAQLFGPAMFSFGVASFLMAKQPDNEAKAIFSSGWFGYHIIHTIIFLKKYLKATKLRKGEPLSELTIIPFVIHLAYTLALGYYLSTNGFSLKSIVLGS